jgi:hypothetical protein
MPYDALETLFRAAVVNATVTGDWKFIGSRRGGNAIIRVGGDVTGTNPTLIVTIEGSSDGAGAADATLATAATITDEMGGYIDVDTPRYEVPGEDPISVPFETGAYDYVRAVITLGGTTPVFNTVSVEPVVHDLAYVRSGV